MTTAVVRLRDSRYLTFDCWTRYSKSIPAILSCLAHITLLHWIVVGVIQVAIKIFIRSYYLAPEAPLPQD
jgi:hypothetical protein